jgi:hypothetical protein
MFLVAAPIGLLAFVVALFLKEVPLRDSARMVATGNGGMGRASRVRRPATRVPNWRR